MDIMQIALDNMGKKVTVHLAEPGRPARELRAVVVGVSAIGEERLTHITVEVPNLGRKLIFIDHITSISPVDPGKEG
jgi:hypothetical protein